jgi:hypothetical protein
MQSPPILPQLLPHAIHPPCHHIVLLKGLLYKQEGMEYAVRFYMKSNPAACVTHYLPFTKPQEQLLDRLKLAFPRRFFWWGEAQKSPPMRVGMTKRNAQKYHVARCLEAIRMHIPTATWILHIRTDELIRLTNATLMFSQMIESNPISDSRGKGPQQHRYRFARAITDMYIKDLDRCTHISRPLYGMAQHGRSLHVCAYKRHGVVLGMRSFVLLLYARQTLGL